MPSNTKYLVILSIILSLVSLSTMYKGMGEVYPFFSWKLFSRPSGFAESDSLYRMYHIQDGKMHRLPCEITPQFFENEQADLLNDIGKSFDSNPTSFNKERATAFAHFSYPDKDSLVLVKEYYTPSDLVEKPQPVIQSTKLLLVYEY